MSKDMVIKKGQPALDDGVFVPEPNYRMYQIQFEKAVLLDQKMSDLQASQSKCDHTFPFIGATVVLSLIAGFSVGWVLKR